MIKRGGRMQINEDKELVNEIIKQLKENKEKYGKFYCPCVPSYKYCTQDADDYICPCKDFRTNVPIGELCHCGLYRKGE